MELDTQGVGVQVPSAVPQGQGGTAPSSNGGGIPQSVQQAPASAVPSDATQGGVQGVLSPEEQQLRAIQSEKDRIQAQNLALQQQLQDNQRFQQEMMLRMQQTQAPPDPKPDPQTQPEAYAQWLFRQEATRLLAEQERRSQQQMVQFLATASEMQWAQQHPGVDVNVVKAYARQNGIADTHLDTAWKLMNYNSNMANVANQSINQAFNQIRQPQGVAQAVRGASGVGSANAGESFESAAREYEASLGAVYDSWPKAKQEAFDKEVNFRRNQEWNLRNAR